MKKDTSWNKVAGWYDTLLHLEGTYQQDVILPNLLRLLAIKKGEKILDLACGQGFFSQALAAQGAEVTGVDLAPNLIKLAREQCQGSTLTLKYLVAPADNLGKEIKDKSFDKVLVVLALQNIENLAGVLAEAGRTLRAGGQLFLVLNHPAFRNPKHTAWDFDEKNKIQYRRVEEYLSESRTEIDMNPGQTATGSKKSTISFHRPLQVYFKQLVKNGFMVRRLEEWNSPKKSAAGPRQSAEDKARKEIPLFLLIEAVKIQPTP